jgi:transposase
MAAKRRQFSREFKEEAVRLIIESGRPLTVVARELGIRPEQLREWRGQVKRVKPAVGPPSAEAAELERLRQELEVTRQERDFLKKAAAFFAKESR